MQISTDRVGLLLDQLTDTVMFSKDRLNGLSPEEYLWEPAAGMWSVRLRSAALTADAYGPGDVVLDFDRSLDPFAPGPLTTIAWRLSHLASGFAGRFEWTFGDRSTPPDDVLAFSTDPTVTTDGLWDLIDRWVEAVAGMSDQQLDIPGFGQYPDGLDPHIPFVGIIRWMNREAIHHLAEVALLRDLFRSGLA